MLYPPYSGAKRVKDELIANRAIAKSLIITEWGKQRKGLANSTHRNVETQPLCENTQRSWPPFNVRPTVHPTELNNRARLQSVFNWPATFCSLCRNRSQSQEQNPLKTRALAVPTHPPNDIRHRMPGCGSTLTRVPLEMAFAPRYSRVRGARRRRDLSECHSRAPMASRPLFAASSLFSHHTMIGLAMAIES